VVLEVLVGFGSDPFSGDEVAELFHFKKGKDERRQYVSYVHAIETSYNY
jgi:hypothetical protein